MLTALLAPVVALSLSAGAQAAGQAPVAVDIYYDALNVPHVFGETDEATYYGLGYQQMLDNPIGTLDRLWRWTGRFAEVAGPSYLDEDYEVRLWQVPEVALRHERTISTDARRMLEAYVRGVDDGRAWWRDGNTPATASTRLKEVLGTVTDPDHVELNVDPLPDYLNQGFHPFQFDPEDPGHLHGGYDPDDVPAYITRLVDALFEPANAVTLEHVLRTGCAISSGLELLYKGNEIVTLPNDDGSGSNSWMISSTATGGPTTLHLDPHTIRNNLRSRYYLAQVHGPGFQVTGMAIPGFPGLLAGGNDSIAWVFTNTSSNIAVTKTNWEATLEESLPLRFRFHGPVPGHPNRKAAQAFGMLKRVPCRLTYFDVVSTTDTDGNGTIEASERVYRQQVRDLYYVPAAPHLGMPNDRHPVVETRGLRIDGMAVAPQPGDRIVFKQSAFVASAHPFVYFLRLGRCRAIDQAPPGEDDVVSVLRDALWSFSTNFMFADHKDRFYYVYKTLVPIQGPGVAARLAPDDYADVQSGALALDGTRPEERWQGFWGLDDLPTIGPVTVSEPEAWINCNVTPDLVEVGPDGNTALDDRFTALELAALPDEIMRPETVNQWRQLRAADLLQQTSLTAGALAGRSETIGLDKTETLMQKMWDFFVKARDLKAAELLPTDSDFAYLAHVDRFVEWIETHRHLSEDGLTYDPAVDFVAHKYSLVTVYTTLLNSAYLNGIGMLPGLPDSQAEFGVDPMHALFAAGPAGYTRPVWSPNIDAMWDAFKGVAGAYVGTAPLWRAGSGGAGLQNQDLLVNAWALPAWTADPRFSDLMTAVDPSFAADIQGAYVTRWGHVSTLVLTPHLIAPTRNYAYQNAPERLRGLVYMGFRPDLIATLDPGNTDVFLRRLEFPVYEDQPVVAYPVGGVENSLFVTTSPVVTSTSPPRGADLALYTWNTAPDDSFFHLPHEHGSQMLVSFELSDPASLRVRTLVALGGTEITRPFRPHQDRFAPSADFANGIWRDVELDQATLSATAVHHVSLSFTPAP